jgi:hypothetical protein
MRPCSPWVSVEADRLYVSIAKHESDSWMAKVKY